MRKLYRFLSGVDNAEFCQRVSDALADGYVLYGNPVMVMDNDVRIVGQAVIWPETVPIKTPHQPIRNSKMTRKEYRTATKLVRGGVKRSANQETAEALYMTSGFVYSSAEEAAAAFRDEADVFVYSRYGNPTVKMFEERLALLEGAEACRATGSGMAAVFGAMACQLEAGDRVVASRALFGACHAILTKILPRWGIVTELIDGTDLWRHGKQHWQASKTGIFGKPIQSGA